MAPKEKRQAAPTTETANGHTSGNPEGETTWIPPQTRFLIGVGRRPMQQFVTIIHDRNN
ncbi:MAG: hypothetical protein AB7Q45_13370 [Planctomycetaceae bacterium]